MSSLGKGDVGRSQSWAHRLLRTIQPARQLRTSLTHCPLSIQNMEGLVCMMTWTAAHAPLVAESGGARGGRRHDHQQEGRTLLSVVQSPSIELNPHVNTHKHK